MPLVVFVPGAVAIVWGVVQPDARRRLVANARALAPRSAVAVVATGGCAVMAVSVLPRGDVPARVLWFVGSVIVLGWLAWATQLLPAFGLVLLGWWLNFGVMAADGGMPARVPPWWAAQVRPTIQHHVMTPADRLQWLGDVLRVPGRVFGGVYSLGDVCVLVGVSVVIATLARTAPAGEVNTLAA